MIKRKMPRKERIGQKTIENFIEQAILKTSIAPSIRAKLLQEVTKVRSLDLA